MAVETVFTSLREDGLPTEFLTADQTLDALDVGKVLVVKDLTSDGTEVIVTLPATSVGLQFTIMAGKDGVGFTVSPNADDKIMGPDVAGVDDKDWYLTDATARKGDKIVLFAEGTNGWYVQALIGTWTQE